MRIREQSLHCKCQMRQKYILRKSSTRSLIRRKGPLKRPLLTSEDDQRSIHTRQQGTHRLEGRDHISSQPSLGFIARFPAQMGSYANR